MTNDLMTNLPAFWSLVIGAFVIDSPFVIRISSLDPTSFLVFDHVQPALLLDGAGPAARAVVLAVADRPGARPAADAWVTLVVQRVVGDVVLVDEAPHLA